MSKAIDLWQSLPPEKMVTMLEHLGVVFELDERGLLYYTSPEGISDELSQWIEDKREVIHSVLWCQSINMPPWYWHTIHSPRYRYRRRELLRISQ